MKLFRAFLFVAALSLSLANAATAATVTAGNKAVEYVFSVALADNDVKSGRITLIAGKPATVTRYSSSGEPIFQIRLLANDSGTVERLKNSTVVSPDSITIDHTVLVWSGNSWTESTAQFTYASGKKGFLERLDGDGKSVFSIEGTATFAEVTAAQLEEASKSVCAPASQLSKLIFDAPDSSVSGDVAKGNDGSCCGGSCCDRSGQRYRCCGGTNCCQCNCCCVIP
jgi:hypothetical protein